MSLRVCDYASLPDLFPVWSVKAEKIGRNTRRVSASIRVGAPIEAIWDSLTDYAHLAEFIPSLTVNEVVEVLPTGARLMQVGEQEVALGIKFGAAVTVDVQEGVEVELPDAGRQRDIAFTVVEGDFPLFSGTWRMQVNYCPRCHQLNCYIHDLLQCDRDILQAGGNADQGRRRVTTWQGEVGGGHCAGNSRCAAAPPRPTAWERLGLR
eukprot:SM000054S18103  [mRNA]  locus=s54:475045:475793:- [translate_table: standard]